MTEVTDRIKGLLAATPDGSLDYYGITLGVDEDGGLWHGMQTYWVAYTEDPPLREIRAARLVYAERIVDAWRRASQSAMVVNTADDMWLWFSFGGNAVVEKGLAESVLSNWLEPHVAINRGEFGYCASSLLPKSALFRAPTPKHRMRILQRDNYRCRVCGRSPNDYVDLELHVHHVRPWAVGGVTEAENLITLCHTCHNGLDPHYESSLFRLLPQVRGEARAHEYWRTLERYQKLSKTLSYEDDV